MSENVHLTMASATLFTVIVMPPLAILMALIWLALTLAFGENYDY